MQTAVKQKFNKKKIKKICESFPKNMYCHKILSRDNLSVIVLHPVHSFLNISSNTSPSPRTKSLGVDAGLT